MIIGIIDRRVPTDGGNRLFEQITEFTSVPVSISPIYERSLIARLCLNKVCLRARRFHAFKTIYLRTYYDYVMKKAVNGFVKEFCRVKVDGVWTTSNNIMPIIGAHLSRSLDCPLHISIFDLPFTFALPSTEALHLKRAMRFWLSHADSIDVASEGLQLWVNSMNTEPKKQLILWSCAGFSIRDAIPIRNIPELRTLAFIGSLRFHREMAALLEALALVNYQRKRPIELVVYGVRAPQSRHVRHLSYIQDTKDLFSKLALADAAYSPFPFSPDERVLAETSFPGKIGTYILAGLPIIAHAPEYAATAKFVSSTATGRVISTLDPLSIARNILDFEAAYEERRNCMSRMTAVAYQYFDINERLQFYKNLFN